MLMNCEPAELYPSNERLPLPRTATIGDSVYEDFAALCPKQELLYFRALCGRHDLDTGAAVLDQVLDLEGHIVVLYLIRAGCHRHTAVAVAEQRALRAFRGGKSKFRAWSTEFEDEVLEVLGICRDAAGRVWTIWQSSVVEPIARTLVPTLTGWDPNTSTLFNWDEARHSVALRRPVIAGYRLKQSAER